MTFEVENTSSESVDFLKWQTPFEGFQSDFLSVEGQGRKVSYIGLLVKRGKPGPGDYIRLRPGEKMAVSLNLSEGYDIHAKGEYRVRFLGHGRLGGRETGGTGDKPGLKASEEKLVRLKEDRPRRTSANPGKARNQTGSLSAKVPAIPGCGTCNNTQLSNVRAAYVQALNLCNAGAEDLERTPLAQRGGAARYAEWFGTYEFGRYRTVSNNVQNICRALRDENVTFEPVNQSYYGAVFPNSPYHIFLGNAFWNAPVTGTDSRAGTILHEMSHFDIVANTDDLAYTQTNARNLADNNPASAIQNADNVEYFLENTPGLNMPDDNIAANDFNDDGRSDLMFFEPGNNSIHVNTSTGGDFWGAGTGQWVAPGLFGGLKDNYFPGDYNGDGISDIGYLESDFSFHVSISTGAGFLGPGSGQWIAPGGFGHSNGRYYVGDFNGDRRTDLMFFEAGNYSIHVTTSTGISFSGLHSGQWVQPSGFGGLMDNYYPGDFDGDGITDLGYLEGNNSFHISLSTGRSFGGTGSGQWVNPGLFGHVWGEFYVGDFTGDTRDDLLFFEPANNSIHVNASTGTGFWGSGTGQWVPPGQFGGLKANYFPADFNGDNKVDLGYLEGNGSYHVSLSTGSGLGAAGSGPWLNALEYGGTWGAYYTDKAR